MNNLYFMLDKMKIENLLSDVKFEVLHDTDTSRFAITAASSTERQVYNRVQNDLLHLNYKDHKVQNIFIFCDADKSSIDVDFVENLITFNSKTEFKLSDLSESDYLFNFSIQNPHFDYEVLKNFDAEIQKFLADYGTLQY